eukprot:gnl/MRDRNA2_/MRDRNA2_100973_c0_seq1.p1 gnl/MRDRNA2_/MRDRNA2_100973_c0~~gnl/MRDRNA2_/MRDRNA2_100973_c0_seq1.p1  ORF type:complete len:388 (-),score=98.16 gnl/MRDRNA2_/MRDRNA2_100973_c0_seq1:304-1296(-)
MKKAGELALALRNKVHELHPGASMMSRQRRLVGHETACWNDCTGMSLAEQQDNYTVCKFPDRCDSMPMGDACLKDCSRKMEVMIVCESKQFCVDTKKEGPCGTTLTLLDGAAEYPNAVPCAACKEITDKFIPLLEMTGFATMDMDVSKMTMGMITEDMCPTTVAAGECAMKNKECLDPATSSDGTNMFFTALCECPCGKKLAKFLWDMDSMMFDACSKAIQDGFASPLPGMAELGPILFQSGLLECFGCKWNAKACTAAFSKWIQDEAMQGLMTGLMQMAGKCDEVTTEPPTTAAPTTTTEAPSPATSSATGMTYLLGCLVTVFAALQLA